MVDSVFTTSAIATFPPARRSPMIPEPMTMASSSAVPRNSENSFCGLLISALGDGDQFRLQVGIAHGFQRKLQQLQHPVSDSLPCDLEGVFLLGFGCVRWVRVAPVDFDGTARPIRALLRGCAVAHRNDDPHLGRSRLGE